MSFVRKEKEETNGITKAERTAKGQTEIKAKNRCIAALFAK